MPKPLEMQKLRVATIRSYPKKGDLEANSKRLLEILERLAPQHPDVVVTPECFLDGYVVTRSEVNRKTVKQYGIDPDNSEIGKAVAAWAKAHQAWVILGCTRLVEKGASNSAVVFNRKGKIIGAYDKTHCRGHDQKFVVGDALPIFKADFGKFGVVICADRRWPETIRTLALKGAEIILNPTYGQCDEKNKWVMRTRAWESEIPIVFTHPRQSLVLDAKGEVLIDENDAMPGFSVCEVNLSSVRKLRADKNAFLNQRRPDLYQL
ncbi:MAG: carbon-nitrogen hydrolase family protein [Verrucomicrobiae bacterium]|nr:carbon-nitrogen hydrolase family protein [Verrucomicrobiae bacterium]